MKTCDNCYWRLRYGKHTFCLYHEDKQDTICKEHSYRCDMCGHEIARFEQNGFRHCVDCLLQENGVESFEVTHYTWDGDYLGNENDIDEVIDVVIECCEDIDVIEE